MVMKPEYLRKMAKKDPVEKPAASKEPSKQTFNTEEFKFRIEDAVENYLRRNRESNFEDFKLAMEKQGLSFMGDNMLKALLEVERKEGHCDIKENDGTFAITSKY